MMQDSYSLMDIENYDLRNAGRPTHTESEGMQSSEALGWDKDAECYDEMDNGESYTTGTFRYPDGSSFSGEWNNDLMHGKGKLLLSNGDVFEGFFESNEILSKTISFVGTNKKIRLVQADKSPWTMYKGTWARDLEAEAGSLDMPRGGEFVGRLRNGKQHGYGSKTWPNGDTYVGRWANGKITGYGKFMYADGDIFEVKFVESKFLEGSFYFCTGKTYKGNFGNESVQTWINDQFAEEIRRSIARHIFIARTHIIRTLLV
jgi:hypothetical protein